MLLQGPALSEPRGPRRGSLLVACGLFALAALVAGLGLRSQAAEKKGKAVEAPKKEARQEKGKEEAPEEEEDPQAEAWMQLLPPGTPPEMQRLMRQQMDLLFKQEKAFLKEMNLPAFGGGMMMPGFAPFAGGMMPGFAPFNRTDSTEPRLGVRLASPSAALIDQLDLPRDQGLVLKNLPAASAAARAGMKKNDILLELNGKPVPNKVEALPRLLEDIKPNKPIKALVLRKGKRETIKNLSLPEAMNNDLAAGLPNVPTAGPLWFRKMDRNRDGAVSRGEFLGTDAEFRRIDTDGDGQIRVEEADHADQRMRKEKGRK